MGLFGKLFEKKVCSICNNDIGLLGNRKLEDGNMCKECASKLSPFFSDRRNSTVDEIMGQLEYREDNKKAVEQFHITKSLGDSTKLLLDEDAKKFIVTYARDLAKANPDVIDYSQVTGCEIHIEEEKEEAMRENKDGEEVSYNPPRYYYHYDFNVNIRVNHPYFDEISFQLNSSSVQINEDDAVPAIRKPDPKMNAEYKKYEAMGAEIMKIFTKAHQEARDAVVAAATPKMAVMCPCCGASTIPDAAGCCEYCGSSVS